MVENVRNYLCEKKEKMLSFARENKVVMAGQGALISAGYLALTPLMAFAIPEEVNAGVLMDKLIGTVCDVFRMIGALLLVWAIGQLVLAFKNEDADSKSRAMMVLVASILLLSLKSIYNTVTGSSIGDSGIIGL